MFSILSKTKKLKKLLSLKKFVFYWEVPKSLLGAFFRYFKILKYEKLLKWFRAV